MTPRGPAPRLKAAYACPVRFVAPTLNPTNQLSGARRPWVNCRPPAFAEEGSMKPMAGHPPAKAVGFGLAQTAGWALLFLSVIKRAAGQAALLFMPLFQAGAAGLPCRLKKQGCRGLSSPGAAGQECRGRTSPLKRIWAATAPNAAARQTGGDGKNGLLPCRGGVLAYAGA